MGDTVAGTVGNPALGGEERTTGKKDTPIGSAVLSKRGCRTLRQRPAPVDPGEQRQADARACAILRKIV